MNSESSKDAKCQNNIFEIAFKGLHNLEFWRWRGKVGETMVRSIRSYRYYYATQHSVRTNILESLCWSVKIMPYAKLFISFVEKITKNNMDTNNNLFNESGHRNIGVIVSEEYDDEYQVSKCDGT